MGIYDDLQGIASDIYAEFKQGVVQYVKITPGGGPKDNPGPSTSTPYTINTTAKGVSAYYIANSMAVAGDKEISMPVDSRFTPDIKGMVIVDGITYKVMRVIAKPNAGTPVTYTLIAGKG